jgi:hypothetical protein
LWHGRGREVAAEEIVQGHAKSGGDTRLELLHYGADQGHDAQGGFLAVSGAYHVSLLSGRSRP